MPAQIKTLPFDAVEALVQVLPTAIVLKATASAAVAAEHVTTAVVASFVGSSSADVAVVVRDESILRAAAGTDSALVSSADVLKPALEAATAVLGAGVLGDTRIEDAEALFADPGTAVFELSDKSAIAGWFAIRIRKTGNFGAASPQSSGSVGNKLSRISNVEMALTVEIGRTRMSIRDVLALDTGAVIELDRSAGAPADVLLNGRLIAHGEIVVVDQDYAVRITKILDVAEGIV